MADRQTKINRIVAHQMSCGQSVEDATRLAENLIDAGDSISVIGRKMISDTRCEQYLIDNFTCKAEVWGWERLETENHEYIVLDSKNPFYSSAWGQIDQKVAEQCCDSVRNRIEIGM